MRISGFATLEGTQSSPFATAFKQRRRSLWAGGPMVSVAGFGGYRIGYHPGLGFPDCEHSLEIALRKGLNLIDTSANYGDGQSEILIGNTLQRLISQQVINRDNIVVISKAGYLQGSNMELALQRDWENKGFAEVTRFSEELWHCIHPEFLEDQIHRTLDRLQLETLDVYLIHNPEYLLKIFEHEKIPLAEAREKFYTRLKNAFSHLEKLVQQNKIRAYGVSSNTFTNPDEDFTQVSIVRCVEAAKSVVQNHNFKVVQMPLNWIEVGAAFCGQGEPPKSPLNLAAHHNLAVLINRPFNAIYNGGLIRLTRPSVQPQQEKNEKERQGYLNWSQLAADLERLAQEHIRTPGYDGAVPLSQIVLATLAWLPGVTSVLCGMRKPSYVDDVEEALSLPALPDAQQILFNIFENLEFHGQDYNKI